MTLASPPSMTATTELVVPRSMPMIFSPSATCCSFPNAAEPGTKAAGNVKLYCFLVIYCSLIDCLAYRPNPKAIGMPLPVNHRLRCNPLEMKHLEIRMAELSSTDVAGCDQEPPKWQIE